MSDEVIEFFKVVREAAGKFNAGALIALEEEGESQLIRGLVFILLYRVRIADLGASSAPLRRFPCLPIANLHAFVIET